MSSQGATLCIEAPQQTIEVVAFQPKWRAAFKDLNLAWIAQYFKVEPEDERILSNPEAILEAGGYIFFALLGDAVVGTCALLPKETGRFELGKMCVLEEARGKQAGKKLLEAAIEKARDCQATVMTLESNRKLEPAINLYRKFGFKEVPFDVPSKYDRADIAMRLEL